MAVFVRIQKVNHLRPAHARIHTFQGHVVPRTKRLGPHKLELATTELVQQLGNVLELDAVPKRIAHTSGGAREGNVLLSKRGGVHF